MNLSQTDHSFDLRPVTPEKASTEDALPELYHVKILFDKSVRFRLIEEYSLCCYEEIEDGILFSLDYTNKDYVFSWILGFGDNAQVLELEETKTEFAASVKNIAKLYQ